MTSELEKLREAQELELAQLQHEIRIQKDLDEAPDNKLVGAKWAMIYLGVKNKKTLQRMVSSGKLEEVGFNDHGEIDKKTGEQNQGKNYDKRFEMGTLRKYIKGHRQIRKGALTVKVPDHAYFATIPNLFEPHPFWIQTITSERKYGLDRRAIKTQVVIGHLLTLNHERFQECVQDLDTDLCDLTLDEAMRLSWASQTERQPFQDSYIRVLRQSIESAEFHGACP